MEREQTSPNAEASDSAYSNSIFNGCITNNSQYQRGSTKSQISSSNSPVSSGYGGQASTQPSTSNNSETNQTNELKTKKKRKEFELTLNAISATSATDITHIQDKAQTSAQDIIKDAQNVDGEQKTAATDSTEAKKDAQDSSTLLQICLHAEISPEHMSPQQISPALPLVVAISNKAIGTTALPPIPIVQEGFSCLISMYDGVILFITSNINNSLGYSRDMCLGRSFIDFVHPKYRKQFAREITANAIIAFTERCSNKPTVPGADLTLYMMIQRNNGIHISAVNKGKEQQSMLYLPFELVVSCREMPKDIHSNLPLGPIMPNGTYGILFISATPISSIYCVPDEALQNRCAKFSMRHTVGGILTHIDGTSVAALGYLPQDIIGKSVMDFYHPGDMALMKDVYETLAINSVKDRQLHRSKPYRFQIQNGCYIILQTEWTSIINPWSHQLEFIIGHNRVLRGPKRLDIFSYAPTDKLCELPTTMIEASKHLRNDIINSLAKPLPKQEIQIKPNVADGLQVLSSLVNFCWEKGQHGEVHIDVPSFEHETVAFGGISPHHEHNEKSNASSTTPPPYNQLNYNANINRYFNSNPVTSGDYDGAIAYSNNLSDDYCQPQCTSNPYLTSTSTSNTGTTETSDSFPQIGSPSTSSTNGISVILLTTDLLLKHNVDMERNMLKQYKEMRNSSRTDKAHRRKIESDLQGLNGFKRCGSQSRIVEQQKNAKKVHLNIEQPKNAQIMIPIPSKLSRIVNDQCVQPNVIQMPAASGLYPTIYYVPVLPNTQIRPQNVITAPLPAMPGPMYSHTTDPTQSILYHPPRIMYPSMHLQQFDSMAAISSHNATSNKFGPGISAARSIAVPGAICTTTTWNMQRRKTIPQDGSTSVGAESLLTSLRQPKRAASAVNINDRSSKLFNRRYLNNIKPLEQSIASGSKRESTPKKLSFDGRPSSANLLLHQSSIQDIMLQNKKTRVKSPQPTNTWRRPPPSWLSNQDPEHELQNQYDLKDCIRSDLKQLQSMDQLPTMINENMERLFLDFVTNGLPIDDNADNDEDNLQDEVFDRWTSYCGANKLLELNEDDFQFPVPIGM